MKCFQINALMPTHHIYSGKFFLERTFIHPPRIMDKHVLLVGLHGVLGMDVDGKRHELTPGTLLLLPANLRHQGTHSSEGVAYYWSHFDCNPERDRTVSEDAALEIYHSWGKGLASQNVESYLIPLFFKLPDIERVNITFHQLMRLSRHPYYSDMAADHALGMLLAEITQQAIEHFQGTTLGGKDQRIFTILEWIRAHYSEEISIHEIAEKFGYHPTYLTSKITATIGVPFKRFVQRLRIDQAKYMLMNTNLPIKEIACQIGISDEKYFMRLFKQLEDATPTEYRNAFFELHVITK